MTTVPSIEKLNQETPEKFLEAVNTLFETAPPLADRLLAARPFDSYEQLIDTAEKICLGDELTQQEKLDVINAHPRIGENKANLSAMSLKEQGYDKRQGEVSEEDQKVNARLAELNKEYEAKYGFKFVVFVAGRPRSEIIPVIEQRIASNNPEQEMKTGITDMMLIARDRLKKATK
ncbi:Oxo-4-hydroxy-4-carboxy-5-ureidoimidazoline decarboxylase [Radiomyces spectabilis]|uniref:Oxo-4-hydroxy-4-carboxy-5-ureidoimidazoline decarboxylase n=1 Tax=Radiomyces spectabilis TaxID=64574 RepID=UPI00221FB3DC|nr:Oxo-4-hydroxy-4-carboxy-5-ureidoimidazoline decarboxylase [Radiomyces spectabilis]KAI8379805.1 Oxo-4-hydroxy-4-carboxy-5-ureidoimidazoline decarboxylase [Radiomyces spectabilis]